MSVCVCVSPQRPSPDVKAELFELLFRTLHHNWRYFFKSTVLASVQRGLTEEQMENEPQFSAIMQVTGTGWRDGWTHHALRPLAWLVLGQLSCMWSYLLSAGVCSKSLL